MNEKQALAKVLGVSKHDNLVSGVPIVAPQLMRLFQDKSKLKMSKGLPKDYAHILTDAQKAEFKRLTHKEK